MSSSPPVKQPRLEGSSEALASPVIHTVEMHTGGEPVRIVVSGYPEIKGATILDKRRYVRENLDNLRQMLMHEPRGYDGMYGALLVEKDLPEADMAVLFMHNEGYSTMCGHATIALGRYAVDHGVVPAISPLTSLTLQCPCGPVRLSVQYQDGCSGDVSFESVPSFAVSLGQSVQVPGHGCILYDLSYGGAFYAFVEAGSVGLDLRCTPIKTCVELAGSVTDELRRTLSISHPSSSDLAFLYGTILYSEEGREEGKPEQLLCIFAERQVDRSPCGSGVTAKIALDWRKGRVSVCGEKRLYENPRTNSLFSGRVLRKEVLSSGEDQQQAVVVEVGGRGHYSGEAKFWVEQGDKIGHGFLLQ